MSQQYEGNPVVQLEDRGRSKEHRHSRAEWCCLDGNSALNFAQARRYFGSVNSF